MSILDKLKENMNSNLRNKKNIGEEMYANRWKYYLQFAAINLIFIAIFGGSGWYMDGIFDKKPLFTLIGLMISFISCQVIFIYRIKRKQ